MCEMTVHGNLDQWDLDTYCLSAQGKESLAQYFHILLTATHCFAFHILARKYHAEVLLE